MIPISVIKPILKHLDAIDKATTVGLMNKKPLIEPSLTQRFCSLLDSKEQEQFMLNYTYKDLINELSTNKTDISFSLNLETHEYNPQYENKITQSDLGIIINFINYYEPKHSWTEPWLFQAKSLKQKNNSYTEKSNFAAIDKEQIIRIKNLQKNIGVDFIRFMDYCPRLEFLPIETQNHLLYYRNKAFADNIFDFALGLELREQLLQNQSSLNAGIFITPINDYPKNLLEIYKGFYLKNMPFSWFIISRFFNNTHQQGYNECSNIVKTIPNNRIELHPMIKKPTISTNGASLAHGIVRGDKGAISTIQEKLEIDKHNFTLYPARTLTVDISIGTKENFQD